MRSHAAIAHRNKKNHSIYDLKGSWFFWHHVRGVGTDVYGREKGPGGRRNFCRAHTISAMLFNTGFKTQQKKTKLIKMQPIVQGQDNDPVCVCVCIMLEMFYC